MKNFYYWLRYCLRFGHMYGPGFETKDGAHIVTCEVCMHQKEYI